VLGYKNSMDLKEFFIKYYLEPLGKYYTLPATITYALIFLLAIYCIFNLLKKLKIKITEKFVIYLIPFVILGGVVRALRDAEIIYTSWLFVSPPIYFYIFFITFLSILVSKYVFKKEEAIFVIGISILFMHLLFVKIIVIKALFYIILLWSAIVCVLFILGKIFNLGVFTGLNIIAIASQLLDAVSAVISIEFFGYGEQHVVSNFIMQNFGTWSFIPVKLFVSVLAIWLIDKYSETIEMKNYLKFIIIVLGLALGVRNTLRASMGV